MTQTLPSEPTEETIPKPEYQSHFFKRIRLEPISNGDILKFHNAAPTIERVFNYIISVLMRRLTFFSGKRKWALYKVLIGIVRLYYKIFHRMKETGKENIPKEGGIIYLNHTREIDVVISFISSFNAPIGVFTDMGNSMANILMSKFGFVSRLGKSDQMVEQIIREILLKNKYFAIWPEGTPDKGHGVMQGFSGFIKVYATVNCEKDLIPLVPVVMVERIPKRKQKPKKKWKKKQKRLIPALEFHYLPPFYFPREWLKPVEQGGKTQRELADEAMMVLAKAVGQKELAKNPVLEKRRVKYDQPWH